jgi:molybdopterin-binding protein
MRDSVWPPNRPRSDSLPGRLRAGRGRPAGGDGGGLATAPPHGLSARNAVAGTIDELIPAGTSVYARVGPWLDHLTPAAVQELGLAAGAPVWLVDKTHSWRVMAG